MSDVVTVHINDAPKHLGPDEQLDNVRALPGETGLLDVTGFLQALQQIGYDGPVTAEPFSQRLSEMTPERRCVRPPGCALRLACGGLNLVKPVKAFLLIN